MGKYIYLTINQETKRSTNFQMFLNRKKSEQVLQKR